MKPMTPDARPSTPEMVTFTEAERREHTERLEAMVEDDGQTWDLSDNDKAALRFALEAVRLAGHAICSYCGHVGEKTSAAMADLHAQVASQAEEIATLKSLDELRRASNVHVMQGLKRIAAALQDDEPSDLGAVNILASLVEFVVSERQKQGEEIARLRSERLEWRVVACDFHDALVGAQNAGAYNHRLSERAVKALDMLEARDGRAHPDDAAELKRLADQVLHVETLQAEIARLTQERDAARAHASTWHRRAQQAEAANAITVEQCRREGVSLGRQLANAGYHSLTQEIEELTNALTACQQERDEARKDAKELADSKEMMRSESNSMHLSRVVGNPGDLSGASVTMGVRGTAAARDASRAESTAAPINSEADQRLRDAFEAGWKAATEGIGTHPITGKGFQFGVLEEDIADWRRSLPPPTEEPV